MADIGWKKYVETTSRHLDSSGIVFDTDDLKQEAGSRKQEAGSRKQEAGKRQRSHDELMEMIRMSLWIVAYLTRNVFD